MSLLLKINGTCYIFSKSIHFQDFFNFITLHNNSVVVEYNKEITGKNQCEKIKLTHDDIIEIVAIIGGG